MKLNILVGDLLLTEKGWSRIIDHYKLSHDDSSVVYSTENGCMIAEDDVKLHQVIFDANELL